MANQAAASRQKPGLSVQSNLAVLRERRTHLQAEISKLMILGMETVSRSREVGRDGSGMVQLKFWTQPRGLTADERALVTDHQREIKDIEATLRAFAR